jgi:hypothetical protein
MAIWVKCTTTKGDVIFANLDNAVTMAQRGLRKETSIHFTDTAEPLEVRETPEDLIASMAAGRAMRRTD